MIKTKLRSQAGFTFIELIIYLAIVSSVLTSMILFSLRIMETRTKTKVIQEVQANTRVAIDTVSYLLRTADGVNVGSSSFDNDPGVLSLSTINPSTNPTIIALDQDNGSLTVTKGS
ncbi:type II secretion system protein, partial [candidate division WWE3 bacterium]|nr:type II secretion system protein [candidate division WWE3 bacterium]